MAMKKYGSGGMKKTAMQKGGVIGKLKSKARKVKSKVSKMMEGPTGTKTPTKAKIKRMAKKGTLGKGLKMQKGGSMTKSLTKVLGKPKKIKSFVGKRTISEKAAKRKVAKGKGTISYRVGGKDPGPGVYNKLSKKKKQFGNTGFSTRSIKGKGRTIRKKG